MPRLGRMEGVCYGSRTRDGGRPRWLAIVPVESRWAWILVIDSFAPGMVISVTYVQGELFPGQTTSFVPGGKSIRYTPSFSVNTHPRLWSHCWTRRKYVSGKSS